MIRYFVESLYAWKTDFEFQGNHRLKFRNPPSLIAPYLISKKSFEYPLENLRTHQETH